MTAARRVIAAATLVVALTACGVPGRTGVTVEGPGPDQGGTETGSEGLTVPGPRNASTDKEFVENFLVAAAINDPEETPKRLNEFLAKEAQWQPQTKEVTVVRVGGLDPVSLSPKRTRVDVALRPVGRLTAGGIVEEIADSTVRTVPFTVVTDAAGIRHLESAPTDVIYLNSSALTVYFRPHVIYFWDSTGTTLIPDLRYLPMTIPERRRPDVIVRWVLSGPSRTLSNVVTHTPGIEQKDAAVVANGRVVVNLNARAADGNLDPIVQQLRWSLRDQYALPLTLKIERLVRAESDDRMYEHANRAAEREEAYPYCVIGRRIGQITGVQGREPRCEVDKPDRPQVLNADADAPVVAGAITRDPVAVALVLQAGSSAQRFVIRQARQDSTSSTDLGTFATVGRPVWLTHDRGLVPINGRLHEFLAGKTPVLKNAMNVDGLRDITALAVAPDGRRVALVAGERAYVAMLVGENKNAITKPRPLPTSIDTVVGIGWYQPDRVVVGGSAGGRGAASEITMDGALEDPFDAPIGPYKITQLVAYPSNPVVGRAPGPVIVEADGQALTLHQTSFQFVAPNPAPKVTAPFFAD